MDIAMIFKITTLKLPSIGIGLLACALLGMSNPLQAQDAEAVKKQQGTAPQARALLDKAKAKLQAVQSLTVEYDTNAYPGKFFTREGEMVLERPNRYRVEKIIGM